MLELKGDFVNYIAGVKTSSLSRELAGTLKVSSSLDKRYWRVAGQGHTEKSKCSFQPFKLDI